MPAEPQIDLGQSRPNALTSRFPSTRRHGSEVSVVSSSTSFPHAARAVASPRTDLLGPPWRASRLGTMWQSFTMWA